MPAATRLAVSLTTARPPLNQQVRAAVRAGAELIELRADLIDDDHQVASLLNSPRRPPVILTVRSPREGGRGRGSAAQRLARLERLARCGPEWVDIEYATWRRHAPRCTRSGMVRASKSSGTAGPALSRSLVDGLIARPTARARPPALILSHHDLKRTPRSLDAILDRLAAARPAVAKLAVTAADAIDALRVLELLRRRASARPTIALAMGEAGLASRVLARKFGAFLTFAALDRRHVAAPAQPTIAELRGLYRWDAINRRTAVYGVVGWPVAHSRSPHVHNAAMAADAINGVYLPLPVRPTRAAFTRFMDLVAGAQWLDVRGLSVTIPHKVHALRWLRRRGYAVSERAARCGAVNTLIRRAGGAWAGDNTDVAGAQAALWTLPGLTRGGLRGRRVDVLGAGGVARAVVAALRECGCRVTIYSRAPAAGRTLARRFGCEWRPWAQRAAANGEVLINCTSVGMWPAVNRSPLPARALGRARIVFDTVYTPPRTRLLRDARRRGCRAISGLEMFIGQAAEQYRLWHARRAPLGVMRRVRAGN